jgi:outer membrane protein OmpA-like peptidoglycan-associated protein
MSKVSEMANYINQNPSLQLGIDGSVEPTGSEARDQNLSNRRVDTLRNALMRAGVPAYKIQTGAFGDPQLTRDQRVEVLVSSIN